jgi:16S rRNA (cytidine1402-2'-O)-methyltransferase
MRRRGKEQTFKGTSVAAPGSAASLEIEPALYVVATPLGNLRDISPRALDVLERADVIAAEDTRVTGILLAHHRIGTRMLSLHEHNERGRIAQVAALLASGRSVALVSDAGTPGVSDPGAVLVDAISRAGHKVVPVPGPSAVATALSVSGLTASEWLFCGFLPAKPAERRRVLERLSAYPCALVFYEAPHRVLSSASAMAEALGAERMLIIARELTKRFESIHRCRLGDAEAWLAADPDRVRGEFVLIVDAPAPRAPEQERNGAHDSLLAALLAELPLAQTVRLAVAITGLPRKELYRRALALRQQARER